MGHPVFARLYDRLAVPSLRSMGFDDLRRELLAGLTGTVVEVGAGEGSNLPLYPDAVTRVIAVEPEPHLRGKAEARARKLGDARVEVVDGDAARLPVATGEADAVVFCLVLCTLPVAEALAEARRVLRPEGEIRFLEHVVDPEPGWRRRLQRGADPLWSRLAGGCHQGRDTVAALEAAGWQLHDVRCQVFPPGSRSLSAPLARGRATPA